MHAISSYRGNRPTNTVTRKQIHKPTNKQDRLQYTAPLSLARSEIVGQFGYIVGGKFDDMFIRLDMV